MLVSMLFLREGGTFATLETYNIAGVFPQNVGWYFGTLHSEARGNRSMHAQKGWGSRNMSNDVHCCVMSCPLL